MHTLIWLPYSPWSIKARWALEHHGIPHSPLLYVPMVGEPLLRLRTGKLFEKATVPTLLGEGFTLTDSWDIAQLAEKEWRVFFSDRPLSSSASTKRMSPALRK